MEVRSRAALEAGAVLTVTVDADLRIIRASPPWFHAATQMGETPLIGDDLRTLRFGGGERGGLRAALDDVLCSRRADATAEVEVLDAQGRLRTFTAAVVGTAVEQRDGLHVGATVVLMEVTDRRDLERALVRRADHDPLTGFAGQRVFIAGLTQALSRSERTAHGLAVLDFTIELDDPTSANIDAVAAVSAGRLVEACRGHDLMGRLGPLQFAVALEGLQDSEEMRTVRDRVSTLLSEPTDEIGPLRVHIGTAVHWPRHGSTGAAELLQRAHADRSRPAAPSLLGAGDLAGALSRGELHLAFQPVVTAAARAPMQIEALLRWRHPRFGVLTPATFLATGDVPEQVTEWIVEQAASASTMWPQTTVSVNVSVAEILSGAAERALRRAFTTHRAPVRLAVEVRARDLDIAAGECEPHLARLSALGIGVILDAAGEGSTFPISLNQPHLAALKVDRGITARALADVAAHQALMAMVALSLVLRVPVIAAGVESPEVRRRVEEAGVGAVQGFAVAAPMHREEIAAHFA